MSWVAVGVAAVSIGVSAYEYASQPGPPGQPNLGAANREGVLAGAESLAPQRALQSAAQQGRKVSGYTASTMSRAEVQKALNQLKATRQHDNHQHDPAVSAQMDVLRGLLKDKSAKSFQVYQDQNGQFASKDIATADFTGYGTADVQGAIAKQSAQNILALQEKYGPQFIEEALKEEAQADPEGTAARKLSYQLIQDEIAKHPDRPVADLLQSQVSEQLAAGRNLDSTSDALLKDAVAKAQASRGQGNLTEGNEGNEGPDFSQPLTTGFEGEQRQQAAQQKALSWLSSGATPEDVQYRREQQDISNLGSFVNGTTPQSQFQTLSGAQQGPAPYYQGQPMAQNPAGAGGAMAGAQMQGWNTQLQQAENTPNSWMAGLTALLKGASAAGNAGYKPFTTAGG